MIVAEYRVIGLSSDVIAELIAEVGPLWHEQHQVRLTARTRRQAVGAGAKYKFVFADRLPAALVNLRPGTTHDELACWFGVECFTSPAPSARYGPCRRDGAVPSYGRPAARPRRPGHRAPGHRRSDRDHRRHGDPCATPSRRPQGPGHVRLRQDQAGRRAIHGPHGRRGASAVLQPGPAGQLRRHHPGPTAWDWSTSWPTARSWRSSRTPTTRAWARGQTDGW